MKRVRKPWGREVWFAQTPRYVGKLLYIRKGHRLSLQYHNKKEETLYTLQGPYMLEKNGRKKKMKSGSSVHFPPKTIHRMTAQYGDVILIEVSTPEVEDVVRLQDDYHRIS
ncbi:MAG: cupin domain-containing protein [Elusimicrobia bacterium]|nr:cupin domain-containing protein [Elusimicrobiota bacterium]MBI3012810.1 cupin domain-containing protein [Elusimicrobiota bacterium]